MEFVQVICLQLLCCGYKGREPVNCCCVWWTTFHSYFMHVFLPLFVKSLTVHYPKFCISFRVIQRTVTGASHSLNAFSNSSRRSASPSKRSYKLKQQRNKACHTKGSSAQKKTNIENDFDPEAATGFLLSDQDADGFESSPSPTSSPEETVRSSKKRPKDW